VRILIADDNLFYRQALAMNLRDMGYEIVEAGDGAEALEALRAQDAPKLAIIDWMMPKIDGLEVCRKVRALHQAEPAYIIILTSNRGKQNIVAALDSGADDFLTKPFDREELQARLRVGTRIVGLQTSQTVVYALARAVEAKSPYTRGHSDRVTRYALALADSLGLPAADRERLLRGGLLHDIGKIGMPDAILNKPDVLTPQEYDIVKQHPVEGVKMIEALQSMLDVVPLIRWHHERLNGSGYPDGLRGDAIPLLVRILSVADVYDALASDRPYRSGLAHATCLEILRKDAADGGLDAALVAQFCRLNLVRPDSAIEGSPLRAGLPYLAAAPGRPVADPKL
jgi:putative two-component system response regulator